MTDLLARGFAWLSSMRSAHASSPVVIRRGDARTVVLASRARSSFQNEESTGVVVRQESSDFIITTADYKFNDLVTLPVKFDTIVDFDGIIYDVLPFGSYPEFEYADPYRNDLRVHTKPSGQTTDTDRPPATL